MAYLYSIVILLLSIAASYSQAFQQNELAWPSGTNLPWIPPICGTLATNSLTMLSKNQIVTVQMHGLGGIYNIFATASHGTVSSVDINAGTFSYIPNVGYVGSDSVVFQVISNSCIAAGRVYLNIIDTDTTNAVCQSANSVNIIDSAIALCSSLYTNGVLAYTSCATNSSLLSTPVTGVFCTSVVPGYNCNGLGDTPATATYATNFNLIYLTPHQTVGNITSYSQTGNTYQFTYPAETNTTRSLILGIVMCNPSPTNRTYKIVSSLTSSNAYGMDIEDFIGDQSTNSLNTTATAIFTNTFTLTPRSGATNGYSYTLRGYDFTPVYPLSPTLGTVSATVYGPY